MNVNNILFLKGSSDMVWLIIILVGIFGWWFYTNNKMIKSGEIISRGSDFIKRSHIYTTNINKIDDIIQNMKLENLKKHNISYSYEKGLLTLKHFDSLVAKFYLHKVENNKYLYEFRVTHYKSSYGSVNSSTEGNVMLTCIEKSILKLDENAEVERVRIAYKIS